MGRRKKQKLIPWFESKDGDERYFQSTIPHVTVDNNQYTAKFVVGDEGNFFSKNRLYYNEPTRERKTCDGDVYIRRVPSWQSVPVRMIQTNIETGSVNLIGTNIEYYIDCSPKYYDKV